MNKLGSFLLIFAALAAAAALLLHGQGPVCAREGETFSDSSRQCCEGLMKGRNAEGTYTCIMETPLLRCGDGICSEGESGSSCPIDCDTTAGCVGEGGICSKGQQCCGGYVCIYGNSGDVGVCVQDVKDPMTCDQLCKSQGYVKGHCGNWVVNSSGIKPPICNAGDTPFYVETIDCVLSSSDYSGFLGVQKTCCCTQRTDVCAKEGQDCSVPGTSSSLPGCCDEYFCIGQPSENDGFCMKKEANYTCARSGETIAYRSYGMGTPLMSTRNCCSGLQKLRNLLKPDENGTCQTKYDSWDVCVIGCGNNICDAGENKCNCPQDCNSTQQAPQGDINFEFVSGECQVDDYEESIKETKWINDTTLEVTAYVVINCCNEIKNGAYERLDNKIILKYENIGENLCNCICGHNLTYTFYNIDKQDYQFEI